MDYIQVPRAEYEALVKDREIVTVLDGVWLHHGECSLREAFAEADREVGQPLAGLAITMALLTPLSPSEETSPPLPRATEPETLAMTSMFQRMFQPAWE